MKVLFDSINTHSCAVRTCEDTHFTAARCRSEPKMQNASESRGLAIGAGSALTGPGQCAWIGLRTCLALSARPNPPSSFQPAFQATCVIGWCSAILRAPGRALAKSDGAGAFLCISVAGMQRTGSVSEGCAMQECVPSGLELPSGSSVRLSPSLDRRGSLAPGKHHV